MDKDKVSELIKLLRKTTVDDMANNIIAVEPMTLSTNSKLYQTLVSRYGKTNG